MRWIMMIGLVLSAAGPVSAQSPSTQNQNVAPGMFISPAGHIITKKTLAECKRQARVRKLSYIRQRQFIRKCVEL